MSEPADALSDLADLLRADRSVVTPSVADPDARPALGLLAASGPRTAGDGATYALVVESVHEGYLLHYDPPRARLVRGVDADLGLLAGDYLYALGLERLAGLGDLEAVRELSDLISLEAQIHDGSRDPGRAAAEAAALWLSSTAAIAAGADAPHEAAKAALRAGEAQATTALMDAARGLAERGGFGERLSEAAAGLDCGADHPPSFG